MLTWLSANLPAGFSHIFSFIVALICCVLCIWIFAWMLHFAAAWFTFLPWPR